MCSRRYVHKTHTRCRVERGVGNVLGNESYVCCRFLKNACAAPPLDKLQNMSHGMTAYRRNWVGSVRGEGIIITGFSHKRRD